MENGWTVERRNRQAKLIQNWKPWRYSTGPTSSKGKAKVAHNAWKGGFRPLLRRLAATIDQLPDALNRASLHPKLSDSPNRIAHLES